MEPTSEQLEEIGEILDERYGPLTIDDFSEEEIRELERAEYDDSFILSGVYFL